VRGTKARRHGYRGQLRKSLVTTGVRLSPAAPLAVASAEGVDSLVTKRHIREGQHVHEDK